MSCKINGIFFSPFWTYFYAMKCCNHEEKKKKLITNLDINEFRISRSTPWDILIIFTLHLRRYMHLYKYVFIHACLKIHMLCEWTRLHLNGSLNWLKMLRVLSHHPMTIIDFGKHGTDIPFKRMQKLFLYITVYYAFKLLKS